MQALRHIHKRHLEKMRVKKKYKLLDAVMYVVAIVSPFMTLPQLYLVWIQKDISGVSVFSWAGYSFFNAFWVVYGFVHKDKPIILCNIAWVIVQGLVVLGVVLHR